MLAASVSVFVFAAVDSAAALNCPPGSHSSNGLGYLVRPLISTLFFICFLQWFSLSFIKEKHVDESVQTIRRAGLRWDSFWQGAIWFRIGSAPLLIYSNVNWLCSLSSLDSVNSVVFIRFLLFWINRYNQDPSRVGPWNYTELLADGRCPGSRHRHSLRVHRGKFPMVKNPEKFSLLRPFYFIYILILYIYII